jgi:N-acyl-D-amino-acid deacylase
VHLDVLIRRGTVVDGSGGQSARPADVGIAADRIVAVGPLEHATASTVIDATGKIVCPGFIDVHLHSEIALLGGPHRYGALLQGVTTQLTAPDGFGWAPLPPDRARHLWESTLFAYGRADLSLDWLTAESYLDLFARNTPANVVVQVPHCAVRLAAMGWAARPASDDELARMKALVREWLEAGAVSLSLGLDYQPSAYADARELVELCRVAREYGAIYTAHMRYSELGTVGAWRETMALGREADVPVHISHERVTEETAPLLDEAASTCDLTFESYMYPAGCTHLAFMLPIWAQAGCPTALRRRLRDPRTGARLRDILHERLTQALAEGARPVFAVTQTGRFIGQSIDEAAAGEPLGEFAVRLLIEEDPYALMIYHQGWAPGQFDDVIRQTIRHPRMLVASDGIYHGGFSHPRGYGCFARVLRLCVREMGAVSLEQAIHKMSGFAAERFRIRDRGLLRPGYGADIVIFDPDTVADRATWAEPRLEPIGIDRVIVNGQTAVEDGRPTGLLPGRVLR